LDGDMLDYRLHVISENTLHFYGTSPIQSLICCHIAWIYSVYL